VVTFIMGRSFSAREQDSLSSYVEDLDILASLTDFTNLSSEGGGSVFGCYADFGVCLSSSVMMAMKEEQVTEGDIMTHVAGGLAEYFTSGDIVNTWKELRKIEHVLIAAKCLTNLKLCYSLIFKSNFLI
jgi:hypothetical protein